MEKATPAMRNAIKLPVDLMGEGATEFLRVVRDALDLDSVTDLKIDGHEFEGSDTLLHLSFSEDVHVKDPKLGELDGIYVPYSGTASLRFDKEGMLQEYEVVRPNEATEYSLKVTVSEMMQQGEIYIAKPGEKIQAEKFTWSQKFAVVTDDKGHRRLIRVRT